MEVPRGGEWLLAPFKRLEGPAVLSPAQFAAAEARAEATMRRLTRGILVLWLLGWAGGGLFFAISPEFRGSILFPVAMGMIVVLGALAIASRWLATALIGAVWVVSSAVAVLLVNVSLGSAASMDLYLYAIGFAVFLVVPSEYAVLRASLLVFVAGQYIMAQFFPGTSTSLRPEVIEEISVYNNITAIVAVVVLAFVVQRRFLANADMLRGVRRFVEMRAATDELTGLLNRRPIQERLAELDARGERTHAVAVIDLDGFKPINDAFGHLRGDDVLRAVAEQLASEFRSGDLVARWGGDEFLVVMQRVERGEVIRLLDRVRISVSKAHFTSGRFSAQLTLSIGVAMARDVPNGSDLVAAADSAMYRAKRTGRNRVVQWRPGTEVEDLPGVGPHGAPTADDAGQRADALERPEA